MKSRQRRRPVRPLTIYGFRRARPRSRRLWLALLVLASLSALPRVLSPIAEKFWGESARFKAPSPPLAAPGPNVSAEPGNAFASPQAEGAESLAAADSAAKASSEAPAPASSVGPAPAAPARSAVHHPRHSHAKKPANAASRARPGLVPAP